ncbi:MAG: coproporphyrinogen dehydrogenase HemZ [Firmicutes bacterium]|nr:coproporphyrinogen dehydrogenase HemZ [Bacillota bacterium]
MIKIITDGFELHPSHENIISALIGHKKPEDSNIDAELMLSDLGETVKATWISKGKKSELVYQKNNLDTIASIKIAIYRLLSNCLNNTLPWGTLTGIRPVRYLEQNIEKYGESKARRLFLDEFGVREDKLNLAIEILNHQKPILDYRRKYHLIYIHIPFCPTRCKYCSFSVMSLDKKLKHGVDEYLDSLIEEINSYDDFIATKPISIYIGGGTPSVLSPVQIKRLFCAIKSKFSMETIKEITFEAGRPDTIDEELLDALKSVGVTRLSINPQSMKDDTLKSIGRLHSADDILRAFNLTRKYDFIINTDIILGLEGENMADVENTIDQLIKLDPNNITVHSLALKSGSIYKNEEIDINKNIEEIYNMVSNKLIQNKYKPYYLYRQKRQIGEEDNVGYQKGDSDNIFNVLSMDDTVDVLAFGMGAVSKFVDHNGKVEHVFGYRDIIYYLEHFYDLNDKKKQLYLNK